MAKDLSGLRGFIHKYKAIIGTTEETMTVNNMSGSCISVMVQGSEADDCSVMILPHDVAKKLALFILSEV